MTPAFCWFCFWPVSGLPLGRWGDGWGDRDWRRSPQPVFQLRWAILPASA
ncbi:MAG: hypothetical protein HC824_03615 [Synechococcales cyanobacterium RM1_1_8]|nr:hypothetical protein [Synechococcales cyanobacterium RM1_1_8]